MGKRTYRKPRAEETKRDALSPFRKRITLSKKLHAGVISAHCYCATVDVTVIDLRSHQLLDMGVCFDYFGEKAHLMANEQMVGKQAYQNRMMLKNVMEKYGFTSYEYEYWDYEYKPGRALQAFDFPITAQVRDFLLLSS